MDTIAKVSKGSNMDQIYLPKTRRGFEVGSYVVIKPLETEKTIENPYFYGVKTLEPVKLDIINKIFEIVGNISTYNNIILTGSFLEIGFRFNDIDLTIVAENKIDVSAITRKIEQTTMIKPHIIVLNNLTLIKGIETDPLYLMMLSKCVAKRRFIYKKTRKLNYKLLDLHLLKSKTLIDNFDYLNGNEKYYLTRNLMAISLFLNDKEIIKISVDREIVKEFKLNKLSEITDNLLNKESFLKLYKIKYNSTLKTILEGVKNDTKQE